MTSIKSLLEQSQDVEKLAEEYAMRFDPELKFTSIRCGDNALMASSFKAGHKYRDAEVERLKQALIVLWEALEQHHKEFRYSGSEETFCLAECSTTCKALAKAREILGGGENGKD